MNRILALAVALLLTAIVVTGCATRPPTEAPHITGVITSLSQGPDGVVSLRVVWDRSLGTQRAYEAAQVTVTSKTRVFRSGTGAVANAVKISSSELQVRDVVEAWFTGAVAESYPVQATASDLVVIGKWGATEPLPTPPGLGPPPL